MDGRQAIDAQRIREVEFRERMRGYHQEDVDDFLEQVARGVEELERQLAAAKEEIASLRARAAEPAAATSDSSGDVIQRTLIVAQRAADQLREEAERDARELRAEAQRQAERVLAEARTTSRLIEEERRKNLMEELSELETEIRQRQEQLATLLKRDKLVRERLAEELGSLLAALSTSSWEREADLAGTDRGVLNGLEARSDSLEGAPGKDSSAKEEPEVASSVADSAVEAAPSSDEPSSEGAPRRAPRMSDHARVELEETSVVGLGVATEGAKDDPTEPRAVQDFIFGHSIDETGESEPFLLWRHDPEG